ncbi:alpha/beta hydrolase [Pedobacter immunditicola]|uniref:alpha/beta hydrolase n=1 Tax=Pedobacter immunditicola TaxID=3133440 RepID=UPI0030B546B2
MNLSFQKNTCYFRVLLLLLSVSFSLHSKAAKVDTVKTYSAAMNKTIKAVVIVPDTYHKQQKYSTVYLLHGYSGNYADYIKKVPALKSYADAYNLIIVCADGNWSSWYFDSPEDPKWKYETYISKELVNYIDQHYQTLANRKNRAITGLSMGGHGALSIAIKHQDVFGAAGSMSGGLDLRPFPANWDISKRLGTFAKYPQRWKENSVTEMTPLLATLQLALIIDCGKNDFFYQVNKEFHEKLLYYNIPHDFISRPGGHNWDYWSNSITYQLLYFKNYFDSKAL